MAIAFAQSGASRIALGARSSLDSVEADIIDAASKAGHPPPQVLKLQLDVVDKDSVRKAAQTVAKEFGDDGLDILVNNAGWLESRHPIGEADPDEWWYTFEVNVKGVFLVANAFMSLVLKSREKTIVNITSLAAHFIRRHVSATIYTSTESMGLIGLYPGVRISNQQADRSSFDGVYDGIVSLFWSYYS